MATLNVADLNRQGKVFCAANVSAKSVIAVAAATTGLALWNPIGSGKKLVIVDTGFVWTTAPAAVHNVGLGLVTSSGLAPTSVTAAGSPAKAADGSGTTGVGIAYDAATFAAAPVAVRWFLSAQWQQVTAVGTTLAANLASERIDGSIVVVPGAAVALIALTTTAVGVGHFTWIEVPA